MAIKQGENSSMDERDKSGEDCSLQTLKGSVANLHFFLLLLLTVLWGCCAPGRQGPAAI